MRYFKCPCCKRTIHIDDPIVMTVICHDCNVRTEQVDSPDANPLETTEAERLGPFCCPVCRRRFATGAKANAHQCRRSQLVTSKELRELSARLLYALLKNTDPHDFFSGEGEEMVGGLPRLANDLTLHLTEDWERRGW